MPGTGKHILVADDNSVNLRVLELTLKLKGFTVDLVDNGEQAVSLCNANKYDLILMDIHMPLISGIEACRIIRTNDRYENVPVIALTGSSADEEIRQCYQAGMVDVISKPFTKEVLFETIDRWLSTIVDRA